MSFEKVTPLCLFLLLGACTQGPDFRAPERPHGLSYAQEGDSPATSGQKIMLGEGPTAEWWQAFKAPELDSVIERALANNHSLAAAQARRRQAEQSVIAANGGLMPHLGLDGTVGRQKYGIGLFGPSNFHIPPFNYYEVGPSVSFSPDIFGGQRRSVERQQALADYQQEEWAAARQDLIFDVTMQALAIAAAQAQMGVVEQILTDDQQTLDLVETALGAGSVSETDRLSAQSQLASDRTLLPPLRQQRVVARHALAILVGEAPSDWAPPDFSFDRFSLPAELPLTLPSDLVRARPDIRAAEAQLHAANAALGIATANLYPHITLSASASLQTLTPQNLFMFSNSAGAMAASVTQTIFDGGTLKAEAQSAAAALTEQHELYQQTVLTAFGQVADALQALEHDRAELALQQQALDIAVRSLDLARRSYGAGNSGILAVLDASRLYRQALLGKIRAEAQGLIDSARLFLRLG